MNNNFIVLKIFEDALDTSVTSVNYIDRAYMCVA